MQDAGGRWHPVDLGPKQLLLLAGHALEHATCGLIRSGQHRVRAGSVDWRGNSGAVGSWALGARGPLTECRQLLRPGETMSASRRTANPSPASAAAAGTNRAGPASGAAAAAAAGGAGPAGAGAAPSAAGAAPGAGGNQQRPSKRARGESPPALVAKEPGQERIMITIMGWDGVRVTFRVRPNTVWGRVVDAYCARAAVDYVTIRFVFDGETCSREATVEQLGLEDGDIVDALVQETGD